MEGEVGREKEFCRRRVDFGERTEGCAVLKSRLVVGAEAEAEAEAGW